MYLFYVIVDHLIHNIVGQILTALYTHCIPYTSILYTHIITLSLMLKEGRQTGRQAGRQAGSQAGKAMSI